MNLQEMKKRREEALAKAESLVSVAEQNKRAMSQAETEGYEAAIGEVRELNVSIKRYEDINTLRAQIGTKGQIIPGNPSKKALNGFRKVKTFTAEYLEDFAAWTASKGRVIGENMAAGFDELGGYKVPTISGASYEGGATSGVPVFPSIVEPTIIPLAPPEMGVEKLATVIPTVMDIKFPQKTAHGTAAFKAEGTGSGANVFTGTDPTNAQFTLSAFMIGHNEDASWELLQDVNTFQSFLQDDVLLSIAILKEQKYVSGTGSGQPQGLLGNVGAGVTGETADSNGNLLSIAATFDVMGTLNAIYHPRASWLMSRASAIELRKAQTQSNLFEPVFTRVGAQDYLHGYPVEYSSSMPAIAAGATPVLFGDFKAGYVIGVRGGAGVNVKILDQPKALEGLLTILGYQRVDGRVRRSEAIQGITLHT